MKNKRFIAAVVCSQCGEQDKTYTYDDQDGHWRACVSCDFRQRFDGVDMPPQPLPTRLDRGAAAETIAEAEPHSPSGEEADIVKWVDAGRPRQK